MSATQLRIDIQVANKDALAAVRQFRDAIKSARTWAEKFNREGAKTVGVTDAIAASMNAAAAATQNFNAAAAESGAIARNMARAGGASGGAASAAKASASAMSTALVVQKKMSTELVVYTGAAKSATAATKKMGLSFNFTRETLNALGASLRATTAALSNFAVAGAKAVAGMGKGVGASVQFAHKMFQKFAGGLKRVSQRMISVGRDAQWLGRQLEFRISLPIIALAGLGVKFAKDFNKAFTRVKKVYNDVSDEGVKDLGKLEEATKMISKATGVSADAVANVMATWAQAGEVGRDLAAVTDLTIQAANLGDLPLEDAAKSLITVQRAFKVSTNDMEEALAALNYIENQTAANMGDLIKGIEEAGNTAAVSGMDIAQLGSLIAVLVPATGPGGEVGNALKSLILRLGAPTGQAAAAINTLTDSLENGTWGALTFAEQVEELQGGFAKLDKAAQLRFTRDTAQLRQGDKMLGLLRDLADENSTYNKMMKALAGGTGEGTEAMETYRKELYDFYNSDAQKFTKSINRMKLALMEIGIAVLPTLNEFLEALAGLAERFDGLSDGAKKTIAAVALFLAVLGPAMGLFGAFGILLGSVIMILDKLALMIFGPVLLAFNALGAAFSAIGTLITASVSVFSTLSAAVGGIFTTIASLASTGLAATAAVLTAFGAGIPAAIASALSSAIPVILAVISGLGTVISGAMALIPVVMTAALIAGLLISMSYLADTVVDLWLSIRDRLVAQINRLPDDIASALIHLVDAFEAALIAAMDILRIVPRFLQQVFGDSVQIVGRSLGELPGIVFRAFQAVLNTIINIGKAIYRAFQWLNPFARHSPSLVENVQSGTKVIGDAYENMASRSKKSLHSMRAPLRSFASWADEARKEAAALERQGQRELIKEFRPGALASFDAATSKLDRLGAEALRAEAKIARLTAGIDRLKAKAANIQIRIDVERGVLDGLTAEADRLSTALGEAQSRFDRWASMKITGMTAAEDSIFNMGMAAKQAQLRLAQMEMSYLRSGDAAAGLRAQQDQLGAAIRNANQNIKGMERNLAGMDAAVDSASQALDLLVDAAGVVESSVEDAKRAIQDLAGTSFTGEAAVDDQLFAMDLERKQVEKELRLLELAFGDAASAPANVAAEMDRLRDVMDSLSLQREIVQLGAEIEFDPLRRQIEQAIDPINEMSFGDILSGITEAQSQLGNSEAELESINSQIEAQRGYVDQLTASRDAYAATIDAERTAVEAMQEQYDLLGESIAAADAQRQAALDTVQREIDLLGKQQQIAQLQYDLQYDPQLRAIDRAANPVEEAGFGEIMAGLAGEAGTIASLKRELEGVNSQIITQEQVIAGLEAAHQAVTDKIEAQEAVLGGVQDAYDRLGERIRTISDDIGDFVSRMEQLKSAAATAAGAGGGAGGGVPGLAGDDAAMAEINAKKDALRAALASGTIGEYAFVENMRLLDEAAPQTLDDWMADYEQKMKDAFSAASITDWLKEFATAQGQAFWTALSGVQLGDKTVGEWVEYFRSKLPIIEGYLDRFKAKMQEVTDWANGLNMAEIWDSILDNKTIRNLIDAVNEFIDSAGGWKNALKGLGAIFLVIAFFIMPWPIIFMAIAAALVYLEAKFGLVSKVLRILAPFLGAITRLFGGLWDMIVGIIRGLTGDGAGWGQAWQGMKNVVMAFVEFFWEAVKALGGASQAVIDFIVGLPWGAIWESVKSVLAQAWDGFVLFLEDLGGWLSDLGGWLKDHAAGAWNGFWDGIVWVFDNIVIPGLAAVGAWIGNALIATATWLYDNAGMIWDKIWTGIVWAFDNVIIPGLAAAGAWVGNALLTAATWLYDNAGMIWDKIWTGIKWYFDNVLLPFITTVGSWIGNALKTAAEWLWTNKETIWEKLKTGARYMVFDVLVPFLLGVGARIGNALKEALGWLWNNKGTIWHNLKQAAVFVVNHVLVPWLQGIGEKVGNAVKGAMGWLWRNKGTVFAWFIDAFVWAAEKAGQALLDIVVPDIVQDTVGDIWGNVAGSGGNSRTPSEQRNWENFIRDNQTEGLAKGGLIGQGGTVKRAMTIIGEGSRIHKEYAIPTDPRYHRQALNLYSQLGQDLGVAIQGGAGSSLAGGSSRAGTTTLNFSGDLSFPNVSNEDDAENFLRTLESLSR